MRAIDEEANGDVFFYQCESRAATSFVLTSFVYFVVFNFHRFFSIKNFFFISNSHLHNFLARRLEKII